ncbi:acyltransferase [uncultured Croceitalea sp.]|uniref:acyltransferase family protein n=1 Tax=uncultured Croceitalea sp. TaxID=1798908 RepID=UPI0033068F0E
MQQKSRLYQIDLFRFFAAVYVLFFHYGFRAHVTEINGPDYGFLSPFFQYGYLGVDLFFIISGFVILMSAQNTNLVGFIISRISRLYPAYWVGIILTTITIVLFGTDLFSIGWKQFLINLTMFQSFVGVPHIDGVYWSLAIELKFYFLIALLLFFKKIKHIKVLGILLLSISLCSLIVPYASTPIYLKLLYFVTFPKWSPYFVAGMFMFLLNKDKENKWNYIFVLISFLLSLQHSLLRGEELELKYGAAFNDWAIIVIVAFSYLAMFLVAFGKLKTINKKGYLRLGVLTYPLYLIHQNIGYIAMNYFSSMNKWVLLLLLTIITILISYLISKYIETPLGKSLRKCLKESTTLTRFSNKLDKLLLKL